jgi:AAA+ ATPase superfamily predicted ATPase
MIISSRQPEIKLLAKISSSKKPEFLAIFGRRRAGKTFLIRSCFEVKRNVFFDVSGVRNGVMRDHISNFTQR